MKVTVGRYGGRDLVLDPHNFQAWFCECPEPDWDGMQCRACARKPREKMTRVA